MNRYVVLALLAVALLSSCENQNSPARLSARIEDADFTARRASAIAEDLKSRVEDLESKVEELETQVNDLEANQ